MINAHELRLGNWVTANSPAMKVVSIEKHSVDLYMPESEADPFTYNIDELQPIPITEDILLKAGFEHVYRFMKHLNIDANGGNADNIGHHSYKIEGYDCDIILIDRLDYGNEFEVWVEYKKNKNHIASPLHYLHELQNLYFVLTGEELKIEL